MPNIKKNYYHIKGTPTKETREQNAYNYIGVSLLYDKGKGYGMRIHRYSKWTWHDDTYGDRVIESFTLGDKARGLYTILVPCNRACKSKQKAAEELFDNTVLQEIKNLGYEIDEE